MPTPVALTWASCRLVELETKSECAEIEKSFHGFWVDELFLTGNCELYQVKK